MRRVPLAFTGEEEKHLKKMLDCHVIQPSTSEWSSPSVLIRKRDGDIRWCIDFRAVNQVTRKGCISITTHRAVFGCSDRSCVYEHAGYEFWVLAAIIGCGLIATRLLSRPRMVCMSF